VSGSVNNDHSQVTDLACAVMLRRQWRHGYCDVDNDGRGWDPAAAAATDVAGCYMHRVGR